MTIYEKWSKRPFQYSSAINVNVADIVISLLDDMIDFDRRRNNNKNNNNEEEKQVENHHHHPQSSSSSPTATYTNKHRRTKKTILDPTCGSGTFLAFAIHQHGFSNVIGRDCNPNCVDGTIKNLQYLFEQENIYQTTTNNFNDNMADIQCHDSSISINRNTSSSSSTSKNNNIDCVVANLPWGKNSIEYYNENRRILQSIRREIINDVPCAFITRGNVDQEEEERNKIFDECGYKVLGQAYIPQRGFTLPTKKKKGKKKKTSAKIVVVDDNDDDDDRGEDGGAGQPKVSTLNQNNNICVVTIVRSS